MTRFYKIRRKSDGLFYKPKWGETGFHPHGKVYATIGHARSAWKNSDREIKRNDVEVVEFEVKEKTTAAVSP